MTDVVGRGVIELSADSSKLKAGVSDAKSSLQTLRDAAKDAGETLTKQGETYLRSLERQATALERQSANFGKSKADIAAYDAAQKGVAQTASAFVDRVRASEDSLEQQAKAAKDAAAALRAQAEAAREAEAANARIVEGQKNFLTGLQLQAQSIGKTNAELLELKAARLGVTAEAAPLIAALKAEEQGLGKVGLSAKQTALQHQIAAVQVKDFIEQVIAGGSPIRAFAQQGTAVVSTYGGVGATLRALVGLISPVVVGIGALAAVAGAVAFAWHEGAAEEKAFNESLRLTGNFAGQTRDSINGMAASIGALPRNSVGAAREALLALTATGRFTQESVGAVARAVVATAGATHKSTDEVAKDFVSMADGVAKWAAEHNKQYHYITAAQLEFIRNLESQDKVQAAVAFNSKLWAQAMEKARGELGNLEKAWDTLAKAASKAWDAMKGIGKPATIGQELVAAQSRLANLRSEQETPPSEFGVGRSRVDIDREIAEQARLVENLKARAQLETTAAFASGKVAEEEQKKIEEMTAQHQSALASLEIAGFQQRKAANDAARTEIEEGIKRGYERQGVTLQGFIEWTYSLRRAALGDELRLLEVERAAAARQPVSTPVDRIARETRLLEIQSRRIPVLEKIRKLDESLIRGDLGRDLTQQTPAQTNIPPQEQFMRFERGQQDAVTAAAIAQREEAHAAFLEQLKLQNVAVDAEIGKLNAERATISLTNIERDKAVAVARLQATAEKDLIGHENERAAITAQLQDDTERLTAAMQANYEATRTFESGVQIAFSRYREEAANSSKFAQDVIGGGLSRLEDALVEFSKTGKLHLGSLFQFMADEFLRNIIKMKIAAATQTSQGGGSLFDIIGSFFGSGSASSGAGGYASVAGISGGRASGGPVEAGSNYIVGENGPEILRMGKQGGHIIPNRASMGGPVVNIINNSGADVSTRTDDSGALEILLERAAEEGANRGHARAVADLVGGGRGGRALQSTYGLSRAAGIAKRA